MFEKYSRKFRTIARFYRFFTQFILNLKIVSEFFHLCTSKWILNSNWNLLDSKYSNELKKKTWTFLTILELFMFMLKLILVLLCAMFGSSLNQTRGTLSRVNVICLVRSNRSSTQPTRFFMKILDFMESTLLMRI